MGIKQSLLPVYDLVNKRKTENLMNQYNPENAEFGLNTAQRDFDITVSFTTFPARFESAKYVADIMLRQTLKPDRVLLILATDEVDSKNDLPKDYVQLEKRGLSVVFVDRSLKAHNKYQYAMKNYPDSILITVDDDILYPLELVETLYSSYKNFPNAISAMRAHRMLFENERLSPYNDWEFETRYTYEPAFDLFATGVGGVLYPPHLMDECKEILFDPNVLWEASKAADDTWLKFAELKCNVPVVLATKDKYELTLVPSSQKVSQHSEYVDRGGNDNAIENCEKLFGLIDDIQVYLRTN
jgi:hypothetical protein